MKHKLDIQLFNDGEPAEQQKSVVEPKEPAKTLTQSEVDEIVKNRLAKEREKAEQEKAEAEKKAAEDARKAGLDETARLKEEFDQYKKAAEDEKKKNEIKAKKLAFQERMLNNGVSKAVAQQLLDSVAIDKMETFDLEPFRKAGLKSIEPSQEPKGGKVEGEYSVDELSKYL